MDQGLLSKPVEQLTAEETALQYKQLWMVEEMFRAAKTLLETRPIFHKCDETIRGHVFCSFLALLLRKELLDHLEAQGEKLEWAELLRDLEALQYTEVESQGKRFLLRSDLADTTAAVFRAVALGDTGGPSRGLRRAPRRDRESQAQNGAWPRYWPILRKQRMNVSWVTSHASS